MKRFAMTISLAACLVFLCGIPAIAADLVEVQSITVPPSTALCSLHVWLDNDQAATALVIPLEFRSATGGAYLAPMAGATANQFRRGMTANGRLNNSPLGTANPQGPNASPIQNRYPTPGGTCQANPVFGGTTYQVPTAQIDFISPDGTMLATNSTGDEGVGDDIDLDAGADPTGTPSYYFAFAVGAAQGTIIVDTCCTTPANVLGYVNRNTEFVPLSYIQGVITVFQPPNNCPGQVAATPNPVSATVGAQACATLSARDAEGDPISFTVVSGPGTINGNQLCYAPGCADVPSVQTVVAATDPLNPNGCPDSNVTVTWNVSPAQLQISCGNVSVHWAGANAAQQIGASGGCPPYTYSLQSGVGAVDANGAWSYDQGCGDVGSSQVTVRVTDATQGFVECTFTLTVTNVVPTCAAIPPTLAPQGVLTCIDLGPDSQADGDALTYTQVAGPVWGAIAGSEWCGTRPPGDGASYTVVYTVNDGCAEVTCTFDVIFENPCIAIVKAGTDSAYGQWLSGNQAEVCVVAEGGAIPGDAGGFDFLICYDQSGLSFLGATGGPEGWEYFTYRTGQFGGNCSGGCPDGYVHLIAIADMNNGLPVDPADFNLDGKVLACLKFNVTSDRNFINSCLHVGFCSFDCGDNVVSDKSGNITWTPRDGVNLGPYYSCEGNNKPSDSTVPAISYCPGAICIVEPPDDRGDLNLNGIANEIGDAVLYTNYFIYGSSVWDPTWEQVQILASDINDDGIVLTVADLIYLIRIITGDEQPFPPGTGNGSPKVSPYVNSVDVSNDVANGAITVRTTSTSDIGAALLVFRYDGSVGAPELSNNSGLTVRSNASNGELRVLVSQTVESASSRLTAGSNTLVTIPVNGTIELVESQFSDVNGGLLEVSAAAAVPTSYALEQNYPNPFNAGTVIPFTLVNGSRYELSIYNVAGQVVRTFVGDGAQGMNRVEWNGLTEDGNEAATGMYFYRVTTPNFTATKKMVLLK